MDGNALLPPPIVKVPTPEQTRADTAHARRRWPTLRGADPSGSWPRSTTRTRPGRRRRADGRAGGVRLDRRRLAAGREAGGDGDAAGSSSPRRSTRSSAARSRRPRTADGLQPALLHRGQAGAGGRRGRRAVRPRLPRSRRTRPSEIMLQFNDGSLGAPGLLGRGPDRLGQGRTRPAGGASGDCRRPASGCGWRSTAAEVGLKPGAKINGWAFTQFGGTVYWDKAGIVTHDAAGRPTVRVAGGLGAVPANGQGDDAARAASQAILKSSRDERNDAEQKQLRDYFLEHVYPTTRAVVRAAAQAAATS